MAKRFKILVVDDEQSNIKTVTAALKDDYDILTALNGYDAISQLKEHQHGIIVGQTADIKKSDAVSS